MRWWHGSVTHNRGMDVAGTSDNEAHPPLVGARSRVVAEALAAGAIVAVPGVGGYCLAVRTGSSEAEARLVELAADPDGPHYAVGRIEDVRTLTSEWTDEMQTLLERCWPGPVEVFVPRAAPGSGPDLKPRGTGRRRPAGFAENGAPQRGAWAVVVGMPDGRALRQRAASRVRGGRCPSASPNQGRWPRLFEPRTWRSWSTAVLATASLLRSSMRRRSPYAHARGLLPASFIQGTMMVSARRKLFSRKKR